MKNPCIDLDLHTLSGLPFSINKSRESYRSRRFICKVREYLMNDLPLPVCFQTTDKETALEIKKHLEFRGYFVTIFEDEKYEILPTITIY